MSKKRRIESEFQAIVKAVKPIDNPLENMSTDELIRYARNYTSTREQHVARMAAAHGMSAESVGAMVERATCWNLGEIKRILKPEEKTR